MSLSSRKSPLAVRVRATRTLTEALFEEGYEYVAGRLEDLFFNPDQCSQVEADYISAHNRTITKEQMQNMTSEKSRGAKYIMWRIYEGSEPDLKKLASEYAAHKELKSWMLDQDFEWLQKMNLIDQKWNREKQEYNYSYVPGRLIGLGVRFAWQAERFCRLYAEVCNTKRSWRSCYQPNKSAVLGVALTPNYNRLPVWVKRVLIETGNIPSADRIGNIWDLIPAAKGWKYHRNFPKSIAKRVGEMPVWKRIVAAKAWDKVSNGYDLGYFRKFQEGWEYSTTRTSMVNAFWVEFNKNSAYNPVALLDNLAAKCSDRNRLFISRRAEAVLNLPHKYLNTFDDKNLYQYYALADQDALLCGLFGTNAKSVKEAWVNCKPDQMRWAIALSPKGNADVVCKFLTAPCVVGYQEEAANFLQSLGDWKPQLRMIQTTTYKVRGEEKIVEDFLVKDTGMLFNNLRNAAHGEDPELGRVRCWLSAHEELGRRYIGTLPNEPVSIPSGWERVNGLCSVDGKWRIELPTSTSQLKFWGEQLHNCVGGYGNSINAGNTTVFVVYVDSMLTYCVEVREKSIRQFMADRNSSAFGDMYKSVEAALQQAKLLK